jgi:hypothetical protein
MVRIGFALVSVLFVLGSCSTLPSGLALPPELDGTWWYAGGEPAQDRELHFSTWPESKLEIDSARGWWKSYRDPGRTGRDTLFLSARAVARNGTVLTLKPLEGREFDVYWRLAEGRLEFWWGETPDWLKPYVVYVRR